MGHISNSCIKNQKISVFLIKAPYLHLFKGEQLNMFPIGLATIAAVLRKDGFPIVFLDPENQNMALADVVSRIETEKPGVVGVSCVSANFEISLQYFEAAKKAGAFTLLGGNHASSGNPSDLLEKFPFIDFVLFGEADYTVLELCNFINSGRTDYEKIHGLAYRKVDKVFVNGARPFINDLDKLPSPVWDLVDMTKYHVSDFMWRGKGAVPLITSRGCPGQCIFCATSQVNGRKFRAQSAERIVSDIEYLVKTYGVKYIVFVDDVFTIDKKRVQKFCELMIEKKFNIRWFCLARVNSVDIGLLNLMKKAGCNWIEYGVESGDTTVLRTIKKGITIEQAKTAFLMTHDAGIKTFGTFMFGHPGETKESVERTIQFAIELDPDIAQFSIVAPLPGTELYEKYKDSVYIFNNNSANSSTYGINTQSNNFNYSHNNFTGSDLCAILSSAFRRFYLRPSYLFRQILNIRSVNDFRYLFEGAKNVLKQLLKITK